MVGHLIVDFPTHRSRSMNSEYFTDTSNLYIVHRHDDSKDVNRHDLWYHKSDYTRMMLVNHKYDIKVPMTSARVPDKHSGDDG